MNKVLRKRLPRDLRAGFGRYLALVLLIVMGIYLVVGIVGSAEVVLRGTEDMKSINKVEDGQFTVFLPLTEEELAKLGEDGTEIEEMFSLDLKAEDGSVLRLFRNRSSIDLIQLDSGRLAEAAGEAVVEKGYAEAHSLSLGDSVKVSDTELTVTGIGSVPDYDQTLASFADTAVERSGFGLIFTTDEQYRSIRDGHTQKAEEYTYAYRLGSISNDELKDRIRSLGFDPEKVENKYFRQTIDEALEQRRELEDGIDRLADGGKELADGAAELGGSGGELTAGAQQLFDAYLASANSTLRAMKLNVTLTEENYSETLSRLGGADGSEELAALAASLDSLAALKNGVSEYTEAAGELGKGAAELNDGITELSDKTGELFDKVFKLELDNLTSFITAEDNIRIGAAAGDVIMDRNAGLAAGVIVLVLFAYVISVFVIHQIEREQSVIGALYALGVKKRDLLRHYITLPTVIAFVGGLIGAAAGFSPLGVGMQTKDTYGYFSIPEYDMVYPVYLVVYALVLPPLICAAVNALVINKKLSRTALSLIKNEQSAESYRQVELKTKSFTRLFAIRQLIRESRSAVTVALGMLVSLLVVMLGLDCLVMCSAVKRDNVEDTRYSYMYLYKYPEKTLPEGGEGAYIETLSTDCMGYTLDVSVIGLDGESSYFSARPEKGRTKAVINNSLVERYGYKVGDRVTFTDSAADTDYSFTVTDICSYAPGFTIFMDIGSMRELFGRDEDYFNAVYSDRELDIDEGRLYSVTTKEDVEKSAGVFIDQMSPLVAVLIAAGVIIFCVVMYLMLGVMIDRSAMGISLIKIFGYRSGEIRQLYLNGNLFVVAAGGLITIPLAKLAIDKIYPTFIPNVACSMKLGFPWYMYLLIYCAMLLVYAAINRVLIHRINRISPSEVLKNRE